MIIDKVSRDFSSLQYDEAPDQAQRRQTHTVLAVATRERKNQYRAPMNAPCPVFPFFFFLPVTKNTVHSIGLYGIGIKIVQNFSSFRRRVFFSYLRGESGLFYYDCENGDDDWLGCRSESVAKRGPSKAKENPLCSAKSLSVREKRLSFAFDSSSRSLDDDDNKENCTLDDDERANNKSKGKLIRK